MSCPPDETPAPSRPVPVRTLLSPRYARLQLRTLTGSAGIEREILHPTVQRPGLALAGYAKLVTPGRIQVFGGAEHTYLDELPEEGRLAAVRYVLSRGPAAIVVTRGGELAPAVVDAAREAGVALLATGLRSSVFIEELHEVLAETLLPVVVQRGVLVDVLGVGCLITGPAGIGKSQCGLELVTRGHRLVADGQVEIRRYPPGVLVGAPPDLYRHTLDVRGVGVFNIHDLYGASAVRDRKRVELVLRFESPPAAGGEGDEAASPAQECERIFDIEVPRLRLYARVGRVMPVLIEAIARNELLKRRGVDSAVKVRRTSRRPPADTDGGGGDE
ncbi:MAG: HPr(Ser) kinase/phosphatase [Deltaproteobacteria bacterium]|nr:HPr(Ser) kinase/phosphatase [Deltaproteobacteria bacterium]